MTTAGGERVGRDEAWMPLGAAIALAANRLPRPSHGYRELEAMRAISGWLSAGALSAMAGRALGQFQGRPVDHSGWPIPCEVLGKLDRDGDDGWLRGSIDLASMSQFGRSRLRSPDKLRMSSVRVSLAELEELLPGDVVGDPLAGMQSVGHAGSGSPERNKPGGKPQGPWDEVVREVAEEASRAGYRRALSGRGQKAAIVNLLRSAMEGRHKSFSDRTLRKYADHVKALLPDG